VSTEPLVSVVVTGYRRPSHLRRTLESFLRFNTHPNVELVLADDGSPPDEQAEMRKLPFDTFVMSDRNRGLGANTNAGLRAARGEFILHLQDDWRCDGPAGFLEQAVAVMRERPTIGLVRLRWPQAGLRYTPWTSRSGLSVRIYASPPASREDFVYTDNPHVKSRAFVDFIGPYAERRKMWKTERDMRDRFNAQTRFEAAFIEGLHCFEHIGEDASFNRPSMRARLSARLARLPLLGRAVMAYRSSKQKLGH
jgi:glycosyltransferase involved in cell wall biosynthesis